MNENSQNLHISVYFSCAPLLSSSVCASVTQCFARARTFQLVQSSGACSGVHCGNRHCNTVIYEKDILKKH